ncbi:MAG: OmpP1/FadL family transporter [Candidatus Limisoma sp.]
MKRSVIIIASMLAGVSALNAQSAFDAYSVSQSNELRGTARYMSMAGAFGALGGDLSVLNHNPGGIGVYRSSDIGATFGVTVRNTEAGEGMDMYKAKETDFNFTNIGYVGALKLDKEAIPNINWGFSYNRLADFRRHYTGDISKIGTSMTNYIAGQTNLGGYTPDELGAIRNEYNPYQNPNLPWASVLAYNSYLINPTSEDGNYVGLLDDLSSGSSAFTVDERGQADEYSLSFGGNVYNTVYWGVALGIVDFDYSLDTYYGETIQNAYVPYETPSTVGMENGTAEWNLQNSLHTFGTGVNFKLGVIVKPVNELRIGVAFHTPTRYSITQDYIASTGYYLKPDNHEVIRGEAYTDEGYIGRDEFTVRSPWKFIGSIAGVIGGRGIISLDVEHTAYPDMRVLHDGVEDSYTCENIGKYFKSTETVRIGAEYKVTPKFSLRAGYSIQTSTMSEDVQNDKLSIATAGTTLSYNFDKNIQHVTCGMGYRHNNFYADVAYVYRNRDSHYYAFSPDDYMSPNAPVKDKNHSIALSLGFRF